MKQLMLMILNSFHLLNLPIVQIVPKVNFNQQIKKKCLKIQSIQED